MPFLSQHFYGTFRHQKLTPYTSDIHWALWDQSCMQNIWRTATHLPAMQQTSQTRKHRAHLPIQRWGAPHKKTPKLKSLNKLLNLGSDAIASLPLQVPHPWFPLHCLGFREPQINFSISSHSCPRNISKLTLIKVKKLSSAPNAFVSNSYKYTERNSTISHG